MNIFKREFKANLKALVIWCLAYAGMMGIASVEFSVYNDQADEVNQFLESLPEALQQAFGMDGLRLDIPEGYYGYLAGFIILASCIYATLLGAQILSREINKRTAETTFTLPVTRQHMVSWKLAVAVLNCFILTAVTFAGTLAAFSPYEMSADFIKGVGVYMLIILLLEMFFLGMGLLISMLLKRHKRTGSIAASITVGVYFLSFIAKINENTEFLKYFTPFEFFPAPEVVNGRELETFGFIIAPLATATFFFAAYRLVRFKDL
ncbi:ABC-type multidrug transport system, permease component [Dehalogenimonas lykanthroporepellens BL-DC-9]|nr:ABC-type multidrug transport system, permease component [Dehalogenimonas lykanthroporepellens BL-DC-9]